MATAGAILLGEFKSLLAKFVDTSDKINDGWQVEHRTDGVVYAWKKCLIPDVLSTNCDTPALQSSSCTNAQVTSDSDRLRDTASDVADSNPNLWEDNSDVDFGLAPDDQCPSDEAQESEETPAPMSVLTYEYHIVYSESYQVPVLYFNVFRSNGSLLPLDQVWVRCHPHYQDVLEHHKWTTLTQQEHPLLGRPYLQLHPCQTAQLMAQLCTSNTQNYLVSWLSTVGPLIGLHIPIEYIQPCSKDRESPAQHTKS